jgi:polyhydroxyalkanoate synthesis regulator phasin
MFGNMLGSSDNVQGQVSELVEKLKSQAGLSDEQAKKVVETIKDFVVEKYPMLQGAVNNIFGK